MADQELLPQQYEALADFRYAVARFLAFSSKAAREVGLAPRQHQALLAIKAWRDGQGATVGGLAERLQMRHNSAVGLVDRLCRRGLVKREHDHRDLRRVHLRLTAAGEALIARLSSAHHAELVAIGPALRRRLSAVIRSR